MIEAYLTIISKERNLILPLETISKILLDKSWEKIKVKNDKKQCASGEDANHGP